MYNRYKIFQEVLVKEETLSLIVKGDRKVLNGRYKLFVTVILNEIHVEEYGEEGVTRGWVIFRDTEEKLKKKFK